MAEDHHFEIEAVGDENLELFIDFIEPHTAERFSDGRPVTALGLVSDTVACGAIAGYVNGEGTFFITSLYVAKDYRRSGGATLLLESVSDVLLKVGLRPPLIRAVFCDSGDDDGLLDFFDAVGEEVDTSDVYLLGSLGSLYQVFSEEPPADVDPPVSFLEFTDTDLRALGNMAVHTQKEVPPKGFQGDDVDRELSFLLQTDGQRDAVADEQIEGYITAENRTDGRITVSSMYLKDGSVDVAESLLFALSKKCRDRRFTGDTEVVYETGDLRNAMVFAGFFPDAGDILYTYDIMTSEKPVELF